MSWVRFLWRVTAFLAIISSLIFTFALFSGSLDSSVKEGAMAAICIAVVVLPYVLTRSVEGIKKDEIEKGSRQNQEP